MCIVLVDIGNVDSIPVETDDESESKSVLWVDVADVEVSVLSVVLSEVCVSTVAVEGASVEVTVDARVVLLVSMVVVVSVTLTISWEVSVSLVVSKVAWVVVSFCVDVTTVGKSVVGPVERSLSVSVVNVAGGVVMSDVVSCNVVAASDDVLDEGVLSLAV